MGLTLPLAAHGPTGDATHDDDLPDTPTPYDTIAPPQQVGPYLSLGPIKETYAGLQPQAGSAYIEPGTPVEFFVATGTYAEVPVRNRSPRVVLDHMYSVGLLTELARACVCVCACVCVDTCCMRWTSLSHVFFNDGHGKMMTITSV